MFLHLLPESFDQTFKIFTNSLLALTGILLFFCSRKNYRQAPLPYSRTRTQHQPFALMNLVGDGVHNFLDGIAIGLSYLVSIPVGLATTLAVFLHETPQEIGNSRVLLSGGFSRARALLVNFLTALAALLGVGLVFSCFAYKLNDCVVCKQSMND